MKLATQLRQCIKVRGVSVTALAKATKVPTQTLHNWLAGSKPRDFDQVKRVADYFGVSLDELTYGVPAKQPESLQSSRNPIQELRDEINAGVFEVILRKVKRGGTN
jgi:transcriptional regulator with XRE-family HTH domain